MAAQQSPNRRPWLRACAALAGVLAISGCAGAGPSETPDATATSTETTGAGCTVQQVSSAVASVDSEASSLEFEIQEPGMVWHWDSTVESAECTEQACAA